MIFSCTNKIISRIKNDVIINPTLFEPNIFNWYVDQIILERKKYFLLTNSINLFTFFFYAGTRSEIKNFETLFEKNLTEQLTRQMSLPTNKIFSSLDKKPNIFTKTNSRSVLGSMNDYKQQIYAHLEMRGDLENNYNTINHYLNQIPMGGIKYLKPHIKMFEFLDKA